MLVFLRTFILIKKYTNTKKATDDGDEIVLRDFSLRKHIDVECMLHS